MLLFVKITSVAIKSPDKISRYRQPDGSVISIIVKGDELFNYKTDNNGYIVALKGDGFYYYADFDKGFLTISDHRVSASSVKSYSTTDYLKRSSPPQAVLNSIRAERAERRRGDKNLISKSLSDNPGSTYRVLVIPAQFSDVSFTVSGGRDHFENMVNGENYSMYGATGSIRDYFHHNLGELHDFQFVVSDVVTLANTRKYYGENSSSNEDSKPQEMIVDACRGANDKGIDFSQFDNDSDGVVDFVFVFFAGHNEAEGGGDDTIWPHGWDVLSMNCVIDGVKIGKYACSSELRGDNTTQNPAGIGTFCHEFAHILGLPDFYDMDGDMNGKAPAMFGKLSLMDQGNYNNNGNTPPNINSVEREMLGIGDFITLAGEHIGSELRVYPVDRSNNWIRVETANSGEYFLLEYRKREGWDRYIDGEGLLVYHIDRSENDAGGLSAQKRWEYNIINTYAYHPCAYVVDAGNRGLSQNIAHVFFPTSSTSNSFTPLTTPAFIDWKGQSTGYGLIAVTKEGEYIRFTAEEYGQNRTPQIVSYEMIVAQREVSIEWKTDIMIDMQWAVEWKKGDDKEFTKTSTTGRNISIKSLEPDTEYNCWIFLDKQQDDIDLDTLHLAFKTDPLNSPYPCIAGIKSVYSKGETINLSLLNINGEVSEIVWFINDERINGNSYKHSYSGSIEIRVDILYSKDQSVETIRKVIKIE